MRPFWMRNFAGVAPARDPLAESTANDDYAVSVTEALYPTLAEHAPEQRLLFTKPRRRWLAFFNRNRGHA
jgi:hypothetical protein